MARKAALILLIAVCAAVVAVVESLIATQPDDAAEEHLQLASTRLDAIEGALRAYAVDHDMALPAPRGWLAAIGVEDGDARDPFHLPERPEPFGYWSDGTWYVLTSIGPDVHIAEEMESISLHPEATLESARQFTLGHFEHRTPAELQTLLGNTGSPELTLIGDVRFRDAIWDPTNGLVSQGDIVRWGRVDGPARTSTEFVYDPTNAPYNNGRIRQ